MPISYKLERYGGGCSGEPASMWVQSRQQRHHRAGKSSSSSSSSGRRSEACGATAGSSGGKFTISRSAKKAAAKEPRLLHRRRRRRRRRGRRRRACGVETDAAPLARAAAHQAPADRIERKAPALGLVVSALSRPGRHDFNELRHVIVVVVVLLDPSETKRSEKLK